MEVLQQAPPKQVHLKPDVAEVLEKIPHTTGLHQLKVRCTRWTAHEGSHDVVGLMFAEKDVYKETGVGKTVKFTIYEGANSSLVLMAIYAL
jgi:hypothetical protein